MVSNSAPSGIGKPRQVAATAALCCGIGERERERGRGGVVVASSRTALMREQLSDRARDELALWLDRGAALPEVEGRLIEGAPGLSEDERAALRLFAWSYRASGRRRAGGERRSVAG